MLRRFFVIVSVLLFGMASVFLSTAEAHMNGVEYLINSMPPAKKKPNPPVEEKPKPVKEVKPEPAPEVTPVTTEDPDNIHEQIRKLKEEAQPQHKKPIPPPAAKLAPEAESQPSQDKATEGKSPSVEAGRIPTIIIDPGHGGKDPGAISKAKIREKDLVLSISKQLALAVKKKLGAKVVFTRSDDRFITLGDRDRIANRQSCDMFVSIHANASKNTKAEGVEIYYLNKASDEASRRLAARENEGAPKKEKEMEAIVSDLLQTASTEESAVIAKAVERSMKSHIQKKYKIEDIKVKTALFYVLVGAKCPSLLIETGFVTNPKEGKRLKQPAFQKDLAGSIADGVARYLKSLDETGGDL